MSNEPALLSYTEFQRVDIRVGRIVDVQPFPEAHKPAYKLWIDFGQTIGVKKSSAQITKHYTPAALQNRLVLAVVNFPPRQIGPFMSEVLTLGVPDEQGEVVLIAPGQETPLGGRLF
ncbi:MAG TPA: tRNA-binding protein [Vicinamibacterales bacterium]|jgi:tRNA-binding protein